MAVLSARPSAIVFAPGALGAWVVDALDAIGIAGGLATDEYDALHRIRTHGPALFVVDVEAPGAVGALRAIADEGLAVTVLALTPADDSAATLRAFADGAHSCAPRTGSRAELVARVDSLLRRPPSSTSADAHIIRIRDLTIDPATRSVWRADEPLPLTPAKFDVLLMLARERGGILTHARLLDACRWSHLRKPTSLRNIITRLRQLTGARIRAVPRVGYVLPTN